MPIIEDDAEVNPILSPSQTNYVRCLNDSHQQYTRFFDALLVARPSHPAFFRDLRAFRSLPTTIQILSQCNPDDKSTTKVERQKHYRDVTKRYLSSTYAHPWCRKAAAGLGNSKVGGWWGAEWSATGRRMSKDQEEQEDKLHKLLIPIWICFRGRMFPGPDVVEEWWGTYQAEMQSRPLRSNSVSNNTSDTTTQNLLPPNRMELRMATSSPNLRKETDLDEDEDDQVDARGDQTASVATGIFRLAAAGMIVNSMPKMQKWKLRRELKKR